MISLEKPVDGIEKPRAQFQTQNATVFDWIQEQNTGHLLRVWGSYAHLTPWYTRSSALPTRHLFQLNL